MRSRIFSSRTLAGKIATYERPRTHETQVSATALYQPNDLTFVVCKDHKCCLAGLLYEYKSPPVTSGKDHNKFACSSWLTQVFDLITCKTKDSALPAFRQAIRSRPKPAMHNTYRGLVFGMRRSAYTESGNYSWCRKPLCKRGMSVTTWK